MFESLVNAILGLTDNLAAAFINRRIARVTVHKARLGRSQRLCYFVNVTNLSRNREIVVTHVWFASSPEAHILRNERPLPKRLKPDETWETWLEAQLLPVRAVARVHGLARVRLSTGKVLHSRRNRSVPSVGVVPGPPRRPVLS